MDLTSPKKTSPKNIRKNLPRKPRRLGGFQDLLETVAVLENGIPSSSFCSFGEILETRQISSYRSSRVKHMEKTCENANKHLKMPTCENVQYHLEKSVKMIQNVNRCQ